MRKIIIHLGIAFLFGILACTGEVYGITTRKGGYMLKILECKGDSVFFRFFNQSDTGLVWGNNFDIYFYNKNDLLIASAIGSLKDHVIQNGLKLDKFFTTDYLCNVLFSRNDIFKFKIVNKENEDEFYEGEIDERILKNFYNNLLEYSFLRENGSLMSKYLEIRQANIDHAYDPLNPNEFCKFTDDLLCLEIETLKHLNRLLENNYYWNPFVYSACKRQFARIKERLQINLDSFIQTQIVSDLFYLEMKFDHDWGFKYDLYQSKDYEDNTLIKGNDSIQIFIDAVLVRHSDLDSNLFDSIFNYVLPLLSYNFAIGGKHHETHEYMSTILSEIQNTSILNPELYLNNNNIFPKEPYLTQELENSPIAGEPSYVELKSNPFLAPSDKFRLLLDLHSTQFNNLPLNTIVLNDKKAALGIPSHLLIAEKNRIEKAKITYIQNRTFKLINELNNLLPPRDNFEIKKLLDFVDFYCDAGLVDKNIVVLMLINTKKTLEATNSKYPEAVIKKSVNDLKNNCNIWIKQSQQNCCLQKNFFPALFDELIRSLFDCDSLLSSIQNKLPENPHWLKFKHSILADYKQYKEQDFPFVEFNNWICDKNRDLSILQHLFRSGNNPEYIETVIDDFNNYIDPTSNIIEAELNMISRHSCGEIDMMLSEAKSKTQSFYNKLFRKQIGYYESFFFQGLTPNERSSLFDKYILLGEASAIRTKIDKQNLDAILKGVTPKIEINEKKVSEHLSYHINFMNSNVYMGTGAFGFGNENFGWQVVNTHFSTRIDTSMQNTSGFKNWQPYFAGNLQTFSGRGASLELGPGIRLLNGSSNKSFFYGNLIIGGMYYNTDKRLVDDLEVNSFYEMEAGGRFGYSQICNWWKIKRCDLNIGGFGSLPPARRTYVAIGDVENRDIRFGGAMLAVTAHTKDSRFLFNLEFKHYIPIKVESNSMLKKDYRTLLNFQILLKLNK